MEENKQQIMDDSCPTCAPSPDSIKYKSDEWYFHIYDDYMYVPKELWPEGFKQERRNTWHWRKSDWLKREAVNERNQELVITAAAAYKEKHPDVEDPLQEDHFWNEYGVADAVIANSLENRDYIFTSDSKYFENNGNGSAYKDELKQFDVVIDETLGGYVCHPYVIFNIAEQYSAYADKHYDDYASEKRKEFQAKWDKIREEYFVKNEDGKEYCVQGKSHDEYLKRWQQEGVPEMNKLSEKLIQEGHITFTVKTSKPELQASIRWVEHNHNAKVKNDKNVLHKSRW